MKTIIVLTDFTISADYTAQYALALAQRIKANLLICNIYKTPQGRDEPAYNRWLAQSNEENSITDLDVVVAHLKTWLDGQKDNERDYRPEIEQCSIEGTVGNNLLAIIASRNVILAMVSAHTRDNVLGFLSPDNTWEIIDNASCPVLVIPYQVKFKPFNDIAIANPTHSTGEENGVKQFFDALPFKITYHYLQQLTNPVPIDLLVIIHHKRNFFQKLFNGSVTRKLATRTNMPLLVFPGASMPEPASLF